MMKEISCPICQKKVPVEKGKQTEYFPFCGRRCQLVDLSHWLRGNYSIPGEQVGRDEPEEDEQKL